MKKLLSLLLCTASATSLFATIRTVSNADSAAQYSTIQAAIDASKSGDSVYVIGSSKNYDGFTINNKKISVFGPGWRPDKSSPYSSQIASTSYIEGAGASGSELHGLCFVNCALYINDQNLGTISNISFIRNEFYQASIQLYSNLGNFLFEGNWFDNNSSLYGQSLAPSNFTFNNNLFYHTGYFILYINGNQISFNHNLWYGPSSGSADCFYGCANLSLTNNIFIRSNAANGNSYSSFQTNITYVCGDDTPWKSNNNHDDLGNIAGINPQMVDEASVESGTDNPLLNFTLPSTSPGYKKGTGGTNMGLLYDAGRTNWTRSRGANLPFISKMTLSSSTVSVGSSLSVTVDAKSN